MTITRRQPNGGCRLYSGAASKPIDRAKARFFVEMYSAKKLDRGEDGRVQGLLLAQAPAGFEVENGHVGLRPERKSKGMALPALPDGAFVREPGRVGSLVDIYRPLVLKEILGQERVVKVLSRFVLAPYSTSFLFHGESGIGKTVTAQALARELGCGMDEGEWGGIFDIRSGEMLVDNLQAHLNLLRYCPLYGSGWKVIVANECDRMAKPAETIWLDALEKLPPRTVIVFTTNDPARLTRRFRDRCEMLAFRHEQNVIGPWIAALCQHVWTNEGLPESPPGLYRLGMPTLGDLADMNNPSFRLALKQLQPILRESCCNVASVV